MLTSAGMASGIGLVHGRIDAIRDKLNAADRKLGDGDTGMTVSHVVAAWQEASATLPRDVGEALLLLGRATGRATGSSLGAVLAMGLSAAGRGARGRESLDRAGILAAFAAATTVISERSGANPGDKTILDSLLHIEGALAGADEGTTLLQTAAAAAADALAVFHHRESRIGRARMYGVQSAGHDDPGMLGAVLLLAAATEGVAGVGNMPDCSTK